MILMITIPVAEERQIHQKYIILPENSIFYTSHYQVTCKRCEQTQWDEVGFQVIWMNHVKFLNGNLNVDETDLET